MNDSEIDRFRQLEESLLAEDVRRSPEMLASMIADDFVEFGVSGGVFGKQDVLEAADGLPVIDLPLSDLAVRRLSPSTVQVTYRSLTRLPGGGERAALRCSIWTSCENRWQLAFHQGTPLGTPVDPAAPATALNTDPPAGITIREAVVADAEALLDYARLLFSEELPGLYRRPVPTIEEEREFVRSYTDPSRSVLLVALAEEKVVGLLGLLGRTQEQESHVGSVGVSVASEYRGRGIGAGLFGRLFEWADVHGVTRIEIEAFANNPDAIRLYERVGFVREGVRTGAVNVDGEYVDVVCLARPGTF